MQLLTRSDQTFPLFSYCCSPFLTVRQAGKREEFLLSDGEKEVSGRLEFVVPPQLAVVLLQDGAPGVSLVVADRALPVGAPLRLAVDTEENCFVIFYLFCWWLYFSSRVLHNGQGSLHTSCDVTIVFLDNVLPSKCLATLITEEF